MSSTSKRVIVIGAGKGIGRATTAMLARRGATVVALTRSAADLETLKAETGCEGHVVDLADAEATRRATRAALPADLLANNAGTTELQPFLETTTEAFDHLHAVNTRAPMIVAQEFARDLLVQGKRRAIVNVSSVAALLAIPHHAACRAAKAGLDGLTRVMALELAPKGIRVNGVRPTLTLTPMATKAWSDPAKVGPMPSRVPVGRFADPDDVAEVIPFLLSDEASMVNGLTMPVDGGSAVT